MKEKKSNSFRIEEADSDQEETDRKNVKADDEDKDSYRSKAIGMLRLKVIKARLSRDTETFGKMDPYF